VRRGDYLVIRPMLPELRRDEPDQPNALTKEFSSEDTLVDLAGTVALLEKHRLMLEDVRDAAGTELLR
jgi:UDP-glucose 4-epimerase